MQKCIIVTIITRAAVLERCKLIGIEAMLIAAQFRWSYHVALMEGLRIPKRIFYGQLTSGTRRKDALLKRFKDN